MRRHVSWLQSATVLLWLMASSSAFAQDDESTQRAAALASQAAARYQDGDVQGAIDLFHEAMSYVADPAFAFNLAQLYDSIQIRPLAYRFYQRYLDLYPMAPNRSEVVERIEQLRTFFSRQYAHLVVSTTPPQAQIWVSIEDRCDEYGPSPIDNYVAPGMVTITAQLDGYSSASTIRNAVAGVRLEVQFDLVAEEDLEISSPRGEARTTDQEEDGPQVLPIVGWTMTALGAGLTGAGIYFWVDASDKEREHNNYVQKLENGETPPVTLQELRQLGDDAEEAALAGNLLGIAGVIVLAGGVAILLIDALSNGEERSGPVVTPLVFPDGLGFVLTGRY
ncbi:MAG: hypothetical protein JW797_11690 [Bradymonadales bacterium]|nr:hypothetical protein [Bradymonadales bacterium]